MKFLILAHAGDLTVARASALLSSRNRPGNVENVLVEDLIEAPGWQHQLEDHAVQTTICLKDGREIHGDQIGVVFNRIRFITVPKFVNSPAQDRDYAIMETFALLLSWLHSLPCPVVNPPSSQGLSGPQRHPLTWQKLAAQAGLPSLRLRLTSSPRRHPDQTLRRYGPTMDPKFNRLAGVLDSPAMLIEEVSGPDLSALVIGDEVVDCPAAGLVEPCRRFARMANQELLRVHFSATPDHSRPFVFTGVDLLPEIRKPRSLDKLAGLLERKAVAHDPVLRNTF